MFLKTLQNAATETPSGGASGTSTTGAETTTIVGKDAGAQGDQSQSQGGESKAGGDKPAGGDGQQQQTQQQQDQQQSGKETVPEKYDFKLPEKAVLDASLVPDIEAFAKANKMPQETAQKMLEHTNSVVAKAMELQGQQLQTEFTKRAFTEWPAQTKADPEIGGEKFQENADLANAAFDRFGTPALLSELKKTGFGNHPEVVRVFAKIGRAMKEDSLETGSEGGTKKDTASKLYDHPSSQQT